MLGGPKFVSCSVCGRPVLEHSLTFHESKCAEIRELETQHQVSPQRQQPKLDPSKKAPAKPALPKTPNSGGNGVGDAVRKVGHQRSSRQTTSSTSLPSTAPRVEGHHGGRPGTMTLRGRSASADASVGQGPPMRVCYICGQRFGTSSLPVHEKKCLHFWHCLVDKLPTFVKCHEPKKLAFQSVDGTVDVERVDAAAAQSSGKAQRVDCQRCSKGVQLAEAKEHAAKCKPKPKNPAKKKNPFGTDFYVTFM